MSFEPLVTLVVPAVIEIHRYFTPLSQNSDSSSLPNSTPISELISNFSAMNSISLLSDAKYFDEGSTKFTELRAQLDSKSLREKLEAMKRLLAMMTLGRDVSSFFPDVVKNVIVDQAEIKKLVYMYLINYAETNQDLALLSINTFQKDLASSSQRIRANAMKAMSSIKIPVAIPLVMLALKTAVKDNSSYVRRAAACAIVKIYENHNEKSANNTLDSDQLEMLIELLQELLSNKEPLVLGAALYAMQEICPDRFDLLHPRFRDICHYLADFDEFGQIVALKMLLRYGRTQFTAPWIKRERTIKPIVASANTTNGTSSPNNNNNNNTSKKLAKKKKKKSTAFYSDEENSESEEAEEEANKNSDDSSSESESEEDLIEDKSLDELDEDHRLLLKQAALLLQTSNSGVLLAIASLYWNLAPRAECSKVIRPLVRTARNKRPISYIILANISTMSATRPELFRSYLRDFFVNSTDPTFVRDLKLDILANITTESSISAVLKEFHAYTYDSDKNFVAKVIQAMGRVALACPEQSERTMMLLSRLVTVESVEVVAAAVITLRTLLQSSKDREQHRSIVKKMVKLLEKIKIPTARTAIVWMAGEYREAIPKLAPDVLRKLAKNFKEEDEQVKMQILNLAVKLFLSNPKQTSLLFKYIMDLCKYDTNYDLRDRARAIRALFFKKKTNETEQMNSNNTVEIGTEIKENMKGVLLTTKPAPIIPPPFAGREKFLLGSLSHILSQQAIQYTDLPDFPPVAPEPSVRKPKQTESELQAAKEKNEARKQRREKKRKARKASVSNSSSNRSSKSSRSSGSESGSESSRSSSSRSSRSSSNTSSSGTSSSGSSSGSSNSEAESASDFSSFGSESEPESELGSGKKVSSPVRESSSESEEELDRGSDSDLHAKDSESENENEKNKRKQQQKTTAKEKEKEKEAAVANKKTAANKKQTAPDILDLSTLNFGPSSPASNDQKPNISASTPANATTIATSPISASTSPTAESKFDPNTPTAHPSKSLIYPKTGQTGQILNPVHSGGLQIDYSFSRKPSIYGPKFSAIDLHFVNQSNNSFSEFQLQEENSNFANESRALDEVGTGMNLVVGDRSDAKIHINFKGKLDQRTLALYIGSTKYSLKFTPTVGELIRPHLISHKEFEMKQKKLSGMQESQHTVNCNNLTKLAQFILNQFNVALLNQSEENCYRFSAQLLADDSTLLIQCVIKKNENNKGTVQVTVNCEDFMFSGHVLELVKKALAQS